MMAYSASALTPDSYQESGYNNWEIMVLAQHGLRQLSVFLAQYDVRMMIC